MFVETPNDSRRDADLVDFCEIPHRDLTGISETPAEAEAEVRPIVVRATAGRTARVGTQAGQRECPVNVVDTSDGQAIISPVPARGTVRRGR
jgi:hypothetical protein